MFIVGMGAAVGTANAWLPSGLFLLAGRVSVQRDLKSVMSDAERLRTPKVREAAFPCEGALRAYPSVVLARAAMGGGGAAAHPGRASDER